MSAPIADSPAARAATGRPAVYDSAPARLADLRDREPIPPDAAPVWPWWTAAVIGCAGFWWGLFLVLGWAL